MEDLTVILNQLRIYVSDPNKGLPEELFLFVTEVTPMVNVDLLVRNKENEILLAWRNDPWWGSGWHVPGGIIRLKETFEDRIQACAQQELHTKVYYKTKPMEIRPIISPEFTQRSHFISFVFDCRVPDDYVVDNGIIAKHDTGYLEWHRDYPDDMISCHTFYQKYFNRVG